MSTSTGPTPLSQIIQQEIASAQRIADTINTQLLSNYNNRKAAIIQGNSSNPPGIAPTPLPDTPYLVAVNPAAVTAGEEADSLDLSTAFFLIKYVDPTPAPSIPSPGTITLDLKNPIAPGCYRILTGNVHYLPLHYQLEYPTGSGNWYSLEDSPMTGEFFQAVPAPSTTQG